MEHTADGSQVPAFSLDEYMRGAGRKAGTVSAYAALLQHPDQKIPNSRPFSEYPKCVTYGNWSGVVEDAAHEAMIADKYGSSEDEPAIVAPKATRTRRV